MRRVTLSLASLLLLAAVIPVPAFGKEEWVSVRSQNFLLVGNASEKQIRRVGVRLEQFRAAFARLFGKTNLDSHSPVTVIIFNSHESYRPFKPKPNTAGFFQSNPHINYITLTTEAHGGQDPYTVVYHEYTHLLVNTINANMPTWFDEGLAEYYSTVEITDDQKLVLGRPIASHVFRLHQNQMLPLKTLFEVNRQSPYYNETNKQGVFYAQSWALMHYLIASENGRWATQLGKFVDLMSANVPAEQAFQQSFAMSFESMENKLRAYVRRNHYPTLLGVIENQLDVDTNMRAARLNEAEAQAYLGDLMLHGNRSDGEAYIQKALALDPNLAMAHASLGMLRSRQGKSQEARLSLERAVMADPENYLVHYYYAFVLSRTGATDKDMVLGFAPETIATMRAELKKTFELKPDFREAYNLLAFVNLVAGEQLDEAVKILERSLVRSPGRNDLVFMLAQVYMRQENYQAARQILSTVKQNNNDARLPGRVRDLLGQITSIEEALARFHGGKEAVNAEGQERTEQTDHVVPAPEAVENVDPSIYLRAALRKPGDGETQVQGTLVRIDCDDKGFTLLVKVGARVMSLRTVGFRNLNFKSFSADAGREITCGPRMAGNNVVVTYVRPVEARAQIAGVTKSIEFVPSDFRLTPEP
ncbi:MAG: tetratricopeptide repeat protein [Acidobacteriota bacterium]